MGAPARIGIFYHCDPLGHVPGGVDSFVRGILQWAPDDIDYTIYGASCDVAARPLGQLLQWEFGDRRGDFVPVVDVSRAGAKQFVPDTLRYMQALRAHLRDAALVALDVLDFHRIEPLWLFRHDERPRNLVLHQDMSVLRTPGCDIKWRHAPWAYEWIESHSFALVQTVSVVRDSAVARYRALYPAQAAKFRFLPTWYDPTTFGLPADAQARAQWREDLRHRYALPADATVLISVGRLDSQKDPLLLLDALSRLRAHGQDVHLLMVGDGVLRAAVAERVAADDLRGHVTLTGSLPRDAIAAALRGADLFAMASAYEGMPIAVLEALASGLPVVSSDVGELRRLVSDGINGQLAVERTAAGLADALAAVLGRLQACAGQPCADSVREFRPENVLAGLYARHRQQAARRRMAA